MTGEYRVIITIVTIIIIIIIIIIITVPIASKIFFYIHSCRFVVTVTVVYMVDKFVKPLQRNFS